MIVCSTAKFGGLLVTAEVSLSLFQSAHNSLLGVCFSERANGVLGVPREREGKPANHSVPLQV